jgi:signal transduction histidine kinase
VTSPDLDAPRAPDAHPPHVLVVDDTEGNRYTVARLLRGAGFRVSEADTAAGAYARLAECAFDLAVLDINLPDATGFDILRYMRGNPVTASVPVMHVSASFTSSADQAFGLEHGADAYLTHPLDPAVFIATVRSLLRAEGERARMVTSEHQARQVAEGAAARATLLQHLTAALARTISAADVGAVVLTRAFEALEATAGVLSLSTGPDATTVLGTEDTPEEVLRFAASPDAPLAEVMRTLQPLVLPTRAAIEAHASGAARALLDALPSPPCALHAAPLVVDRGPGARVLGAMLFMWSEERAAGAAEQALITAVADQCALALERARLYDAERAARAAAEEASLAKTQLLSMLSHELRTPLNSVRGNLDLIDAGVYGELTPGQRDALARAQRSAIYLTGLINDLLNFARMESGQLDYEIRDVTLAGPDGLLREITALTSTQAAEKGVTLLGAPGDARVVRADADKVRMILTNLMTNAIKFTDAGGTIAVEVDPVDAAGMVRLRVRDTGRGIPTDDLERIFEPFVQVNRAATQSSQQGVGLGLAISRTLARAMGGDLSAESAPGEGSTFTLVLPNA